MLTVAAEPFTLKELHEAVAESTLILEMFRQFMEPKPRWALSG